MFPISHEIKEGDLVKCKPGYSNLFGLSETYAGVGYKSGFVFKVYAIKEVSFRSRRSKPRTPAAAVCFPKKGNGVLSFALLKIPSINEFF